MLSIRLFRVFYSVMLLTLSSYSDKVVLSNRNFTSTT